MPKNQKIGKICQKFDHPKIKTCWAKLPENLPAERSRRAESDFAIHAFQKCVKTAKNALLK